MLLTSCLLPIAHMLGIVNIFNEDTMMNLVVRGGPPVLFGLLFACGVGLPLPEDIPLLLAGAMVATGKMSLPVAAICAWCGIIGGDCVLYHLGKIFGNEITKLPVIGHHVNKERIAYVEKRFERYGVWVVAVGRLFAGIRGAMVVCAGAIRFPFWKFVIADGLAAIVSGGLFLALGYWFGNEMPTLLHHVKKAKQGVLIGVLVVGVGIGIWLWLRARQRQRLFNQRGFVPAGLPGASPVPKTEAETATANEASQ